VAALRAGGDVIVISFDEFEEVLGGIFSVGEDEDLGSYGVNGSVVVSGCNVGGTALLASFEDDGAHHAGLGELLF